MKGFKAFKTGLICGDKQYTENTTFEEDWGEGFHFRLKKDKMYFRENPFDCLDDYPIVDRNGNFSEFAEVEALDEVGINNNGKYTTKKLHIGARLDFKGFIKTGIDFLCKKTIKDVPEGEIDSGSFARIGSSDDHARICSSGEYARIDSSGSFARIGSYGANAHIGSSGDNAHIGSSGYGTHIGSSDYFAQIGSSGDYVTIGSSGSAAQIGSSGANARIGSSGCGVQIGSSGDAAQISSSGDNARIGSSGDDAKICSSGYGTQIGSSGNFAQIASSGNFARINVIGTGSVVAAIGAKSRIKAKKGNWITLAEWKYDENKKKFVPLCVKSAFVDGDNLQDNVWYELEAGEFKEVRDE